MKLRALLPAGAVIAWLVPCVASDAIGGVSAGAATDARVLQVQA